MQRPKAASPPRQPSDVPDATVSTHPLEFESPAEACPSVQPAGATVERPSFEQAKKKKMKASKKAENSEFFRDHGRGRKG